MGWEYVHFRSIYELQRKTGVLKNKFPTNPKEEQFISLKKWRQTAKPFFFKNKESITFPKQKSKMLQDEFEDFQSGKIKYFNAETIEIGNNYNWLINPSTGFEYDVSRHWTEVEDLSKEAGDIKYVWEKSRFSFIYNLIRYDYHFEADNAELVFKEIESWIDANPINQGPNYKCSQEISLRILNWTFALYYYKNSNTLTEHRFNKIIHLIYWQLKHVFHNINFSLKAVRNNHAISESLMLYLGGLLFPFFPESKLWKEKGKAWFEQEIKYQVYEDGTFLQFSHNYHRVVIQLMTWAFYLSRLNEDRFSDAVYARAKKSLDYLFQCTDKTNGQLPNYGANDGALFFKLNNQPYRDYRPQLNALYFYFNQTSLFKEETTQEDIQWMAANKNQLPHDNSFTLALKNKSSFSKGGYYTIRDQETLTFIRCGSYKDRPSHADNLHLDLWYKGENILRDSGTYKYNTSTDLIKYFNGTSAHNTITLGDFDQMLKGPRFIWLHWSKAVKRSLKEEKDFYEFEGKIEAFKQAGKSIYHTRKLKKFKHQAYWEVEDLVYHSTDLSIKQYWNVAPGFEKKFRIEAWDEQGNKIKPNYKKGYYSGLYGVKEETQVIVFETTFKKIKTSIQLI